MFIVERQAPNGAATKYHRATSFQWAGGETHVVVDSYHAEEMAIISWRDTYTIPPEARIGSIADAEALLVAPGAPFAGAVLIPEDAGDLAVARARKWAEVKARRAAIDGGGCETPSGRVQTDLESRTRIHGYAGAAARALASGAAWSIEFILANNQEVTVTAAEMVAIDDAVNALLDASSARSQALRAAIDAAETPESVAAIDITTGWPGTE